MEGTLPAGHDLPDLGHLVGREIVQNPSKSQASRASISQQGLVVWMLVC